MATQEVPQEDWQEFFDDLSREHEEGIARIEVRGDGLPQQVAVGETPLIGISYETEGSGAGRVDIMLGTDPDEHVVHTISDPQFVKYEEDAAGTITSVEIDSESALTTLIQFLSVT